MKANSVADYLVNLDDSDRSVIEHLLKLVKDDIPEAELVLTYGMPGYKYHGKYLVGFAAFRDHMSVFPAAEPIEVLHDKLSAFKLSRGTVQFTHNNMISDDIVRELVAIRHQAIDR